MTKLKGSDRPSLADVINSYHPGGYLRDIEGRLLLTGPANDFIEIKQEDAGYWARLKVNPEKLAGHGPTVEDALKSLGELCAELLRRSESK